MEKYLERFEEKGFSFKFNKGDNSFFHCLYSEPYKSPSDASKNANRLQKELFELEFKNSTYFHIFQPCYSQCDGDHSAVGCLKKELEKMRKEKKPLCPREVFAAADLLQRYICVYRCQDFNRIDIENFRGYKFAPANKNCIDEEPLCILMLEKQNGPAEFATFCHETLTKCLSKCPGVLLNKNHTHCIGFRFRNSFSILFDERFVGMDPGIRQEFEEKDIYHHLSLEMYGTESYHVRVLNIICTLEQMDDNVDLFCKYANDSVTDKTKFNQKKKFLKEHVENIKNGTKPPGDGEFYALSSVYNVEIIIDDTGYGEWKTYMPVIFTYANCFESPIILRKERRNGEYLPYITELNACSCLQNPPEIQGQIGRVKVSIHEAVLKTPCCPTDQRRKNHEHLRNIPSIRTDWPEQVKYIQPSDEIDIVINRLKIEDRRLDQIDGGNGTLAKALAKELYGDENEDTNWELQNAVGEENLNLDEKLLRLSEWLNVPLYVYYGMAATSTAIDGLGRWFWAIYEPTVSRTKRNCRFYITLFCNLQDKSFDRITPLKGCNCQIPPPLSVLFNNQNLEQEYLGHIYPRDRHHPLVTFLSEDPESNNFQVEVRDFPVCSPFSAVRIAIAMETMKERTLDCVEFGRHSFLRCLSKEIFGNENNVDIFKTELSNELLQNISEYIPFIGQKILNTCETTTEKLKNDRKSREKIAKIINDRIEDDLPCDDLMLWLACTFFQTPIYVFRVNDTETSTTGDWTVYEKVYRRKRNPHKKTSFAKKCHKDSIYYISLLEAGIKQYHRIIPKLKECNCMLKEPSCRHEIDPTEYHSQHDCRLLRIIRSVDNCLNVSCVEIEQWLFCNQILQQQCDLMILDLEGRRKNVNIATVTGTTTGIVGAALTGVGIGLAPVTAGVSTILTIIGAAIAVSGGTVTTGAKITESVLNYDRVNTLKRYMNVYQERLENLESVMCHLREELVKLGELSTEIQAHQNIDSTNFANLQSIPGIVRAIKGLVMIPLTVLKISSRGLLILGAIIGPVSAIVDVTLLFFSVYNMVKGNKTDVTENLRRIAASLYGSRRQMHSWAYGNQRRFTYI